MPKSKYIPEELRKSMFEMHQWADFTVKPVGYKWRRVGRIVNLVNESERKSG